MILHQNDNTAVSLESREKIYHSIYSIMYAYRKICTQMNVEHPQLKAMFSSISRDRRVAETILTHAPISENKSPILGSRSVHPLLDETRRNLKESNLTHLFEIWPIPEASQRLFNEICRLKFMIPQESDYIINHFLYREKFLEFLMRLDRVGIKVNKNPHLPLITNAYQLDTLGFFREGAYLGSTGHWKAQIQKPPSVICCTNPHALGNCVGQPLRHIVMRVFLGTGEFYESPFILDSTLRYGQMDEEGGIQALFMRPGLFIIDVPSAIEEHWKKVQSHQIKTKLGDIIKEKIRVEN
jgi:hypothetical protein